MRAPRLPGVRPAAPAVAPALVAVLLAVLLAACGGEEKVEVASSDLLDLNADQVMTGVEHTMTREGVRRAHLEADTAYFLQNGSVAHFRHYEIDFFDPAGTRRSTLRAVDGIYDMKSGDMKAKGDVVVVDSIGGQRLETSALQYDATADRLRSDTSFVLYRQRDTIRGRGFVTDPSMDTVRVVQPSAVSPAGAGTGGAAADTGGRAAADSGRARDAAGSTAGSDSAGGT
ncbi:MAG TPA: LPS export ABC transporter periplasmic protein LptC [Gemmatimonadota bacterium]|nr:LPS export ABC transporter periplasmic protein LptC [Gemmatimonadota bacterium]